MLTCFSTKEASQALPIILLTQHAYANWLSKQTSQVQTWAEANQFRAEAGQKLLLPDANGNLSQVVFGLGKKINFWDVGSLPMTLPEGNYRYELSDIDNELLTLFYLAWGLGAYQFTRYKKASRQPATLFILKEKLPEIENTVAAIYFVRDLINTPTDDMGPTELAQAVEKFAASYQAEFKQIVGDELLTDNYPGIHTVGRASDDAPRLLDMTWGDANNPKVTLVGKGVCFDTGGLDLKPSAAMLLMKKDMGGAAHVLGLAKMIMQAKLPVRLRVLIPAVENSVSGNAYRPGDVITSRKGLTIEVGNTDAEGRVVLADALTEAASEHPDIIIDISTLTGAARVALGTELPGVFANDDKVVNALLQCAEQYQDPIWRLPLFAPYREHINSNIADLNNNSSDPYAGAISAALFLKEFVPDNLPWLHFDLMAWNTKSRPGRPQGGEAVAIRALFHYLQGCYSSS